MAEVAMALVRGHISFQNFPGLVDFVTGDRGDFDIGAPSFGKANHRRATKVAELQTVQTGGKGCLG
jgi:hypothetical protein